MKDELYEIVLGKLKAQKTQYENELVRLHNNPHSFLTQAEDIIMCLDGISTINNTIELYMGYIAVFKSEEKIKE